jgi:hypothetical protein
MTGREPKLENDLFFVCSLVEQIGRTTKNRRGDVVSALGKDVIAKYLDLADVFHCEPLEHTAADLIEKCGIRTGIIDNTVGVTSVPRVFDIGKVYKRLIVDIARHCERSLVDVFMDVYTSWISDKISDYRSSMYYESPEYLYLSYLEGEPLKD